MCSLSRFDKICQFVKICIEILHTQDTGVVRLLLEFTGVIPLDQGVISRATET